MKWKAVLYSIYIISRYASFATTLNPIQSDFHTTSNEQY